MIARAVVLMVAGVILPPPGMAQFGAQPGASAGSRLLEPTTQTSIGIFYQPDAPNTTMLWREGDRGQRLDLRGRVVTTHGVPIANARVELWHADTDGGVDETRYRATLHTEADGTFGIRTVLPGHIEMARDNIVFAGRHIHVVVTHPRHERLVSLIFFKADERLQGSPYPELAIALDETRSGDHVVYLGRVQIVLK